GGNTARHFGAPISFPVGPGYPCAWGRGCPARDRSFLGAALGGCPGGSGPGMFPMSSSWFLGWVDTDAIFPYLAGRQLALVVGDVPIVVGGEDRQVRPVAWGQAPAVHAPGGGGTAIGDPGQDLGIGQFFKGSQDTGLGEQVPHGGGTGIVVTGDGQRPASIQDLSGRGKAATQPQGGPGQGGGHGGALGQQPDLPFPA